MAVSFEQPTSAVDAYDFVEVSAKTATPAHGNPFTDVQVSGEFRTGEFRTGDGEPVRVEGFCDSPDVTCYRIRFMPRRPGSYSYEVRIEGPGIAEGHSGTFEARAGT